MRQPLTITVVQPRCVSLDVAGNALRHASAVRDADARVVVFPELSLTGYELAAPAVTVDDARLEPIVGACADTGAVALVGAPVAGPGDRAYIAMLAIDGTVARIVYRKMWLGGSEPDRFSPGEAPAVIELDGWRLGLAICKDTRIAQHAADTAELGMDVYVAGMVESADEAAAPDERARRVTADHNVEVAIASHAGPTGGGFDETAGGSGIWSSDGRRVAHAGAEIGAIARATLT
jgi:predicted amidohydrolase